MNKKILVVSILTILMLVTISFATAVTSNTNTTNSKKKESPLFKIRTELAIGERIKDLVTRFLGQRIFFLTFQWLKEIFFLTFQWLKEKLINSSIPDRLDTEKMQSVGCYTCTPFSVCHPKCNTYETPKCH
ncbi:MAG: hypothetical protein ACQXXD_02780 [Thermoplasmatota archaeon]